jgi:16S rRNA G527 N7-methylase RsmG
MNETPASKPIETFNQECERPAADLATSRACESKSQLLKYGLAARVEPKGYLKSFLMKSGVNAAVLLLSCDITGTLGNARFEP